MGAAVTERITERHRLVALYSVLGWDNERIALTVGCTTATVCNHKRNPIVKMLAEEMRAKFAERATADALEDLRIDAPKNVEFLRRVRDGDRKALGGDTDPEWMRFRMDASKTLLDRQAPKRQETTIDQTMRIVIEADDARDLDMVARELGEDPIDITPVGEGIDEDAVGDPGLASTDDPEPLVRGIDTLDDVLARYDAER